MNINEKIQDTISKNDVVLFLKGTPDMPQCGFSMAVCKQPWKNHTEAYLEFPLKIAPHHF